MTIRLIVNADDYGLTAGVSRGIREAHLNGIVTSTTAMMNMAAAAESLKIANKEAPRLGIGVHLVLSAGGPVLPAAQVPSLVEADGSFHKQDQILAHPARLSPSEAEAEFRAQIERFVGAAGRPPTHLDSHHHMSYVSEGVFQAMLKLAGEYGCPIRRPIAADDPTVLMPEDLVESIGASDLRRAPTFKPRHTDGFLTAFYDDGATKENLLKILASLKEGASYEIMSHPAHTDDDLHSSYFHQRERELAVLTDPDVTALIKRRGIELISFAQL